MIVICEDCGNKYRIDPGKIKGDTAKFKCKTCSHIITVFKPKPKPPQPEPEPPPFIEPDDEVRQSETAEIETAPDRTNDAAGADRPRVTVPLKKGGIGLQTKMFVLFFFFPILLFAASSMLVMRQVNTLSTQMTEDGSRIITEMAEEKMADFARAVAMQCRLYLLMHPKLEKKNFRNDYSFKGLAVQKVGMTGYTAQYEVPGQDGIWRTWSHVNQKIVGIDMKKLEKPLGSNFAGFWRVYTGVRNGRESKGYYTWQDKDGSFKKKFMVCTPIEGTPYIIAATTYLDELTRKERLLSNRSWEMSDKMQNTIWVIWGVTLLLVAVVVLFYGRRLAGRIRSLTNIAERISIGELEADISTQAKDEIGELAESISRMQDSIRLSIERLRRRRSAGR